MPGRRRLNNDEYSRLPHYRNLDKLNGTYNDDEITDEMLEEFANDVRAYAREYNEAVANIKIPSVEEIQNHYSALSALAESELKDLNNKYSLEQLCMLSDYDRSTVISRIKSLRSEIATYQNRIVNAAQIRKVQWARSDLAKSAETIANRRKNKSWYYTEVRDIMAKI